MIEIIGFIALHADLLHDSSRRTVRRHCERNDLVQLEPFKSEPEDRSGSFCSVAAIPVISRDPPADFHRRSEVGLEAGNSEPDEAHEGCNVRNFDSPEPESVLFKARIDPCCEGVAFLPRKRTRKVFHHTRVGIHLCEWFQVSRDPATKAQVFGLDHPEKNPNTPAALRQE